MPDLNPANQRTIMILEDNEARLQAFQAAVVSLGPDFCLRCWHDAPTMMAECLPGLPNCCLISLDHDLHPMPGATQDPGTGLEVAELLGRQEPVCPVIIHTSNSERRWSMHNEFRFGHWQVTVVPPMGEDWIPRSWLPRVRELLEVYYSTSSRKRHSVGAPGCGLLVIRPMPRPPVGPPFPGTAL
jgi:hypothetical protein